MLNLWHLPRYRGISTGLTRISCLSRVQSRVPCCFFINQKNISITYPSTIRVRCHFSSRVHSPMQFSTFVGGQKRSYLSIRVINVFRSFEACVMQLREEARSPITLFNKTVANLRCAFFVRFVLYRDNKVCIERERLRDSRVRSTLPLPIAHNYRSRVCNIDWKEKKRIWYNKETRINGGEKKKSEISLAVRIIYS